MDDHNRKKQKKQKYSWAFYIIYMQYIWKWNKMLIPSGAEYEAIEIEKIQGPYWKLGFYKSTEVRQCHYLHIVTCDIYELWYPKQALWKCRFTEFIQYIKDHILEVYKQTWWGLVKTILVKMKSWLVKLAHLIFQYLGERNRRLT